MMSAFQCYAQEGDQDWEAICVDLDIAVSSRSFEEVRGSLGTGIRMYLEWVASSRKGTAGGCCGDGPPGTYEPSWPE